MQYINYIKGWLASTRRRLTSIKGRPAGRRRRQASRVERAQLLLITALALAVILVTVALLLNAAIFTENVATRDTTADGHEAIELRGELVDGIGELIERENRQEQTEAERIDSIESGIEASAPMVDRERARGGTVATLRYDSHEPGKLLKWDESSTFDTLDNETVVSGLSNARAFEMVFESHDSLSSPNASEIEDDAFGVQFITEGDNVTQYIYADSGTVVVAEAIEDRDPQPQCTVSQSGPTTVDLTGDRLSTDDEIRECHRGLWPDDDLDSIVFLNGAESDGSFSLTVDELATASGSLQSEDAIYSVTVDIGYQSQDLTFETTARVAPGEPR